MLGEFFTQQTAITPDEIGASPLATPNKLDALKEQVAQGFDRTTTGRFLEERDIVQAEKAEGTYDADYYRQQEAIDLYGGTPPGWNVQPHAHAMKQEDWKASKYYREGIEWREDMTETRARKYAENYDQRRFAEQVVKAGDEAYGLGFKALGVGAMLVGSLPDPVNFIPFVGGATKGATVGKAAVGSVGSKILAGAKAGAKGGAIEGAAGNLLADAIVLPDLAKRGEDVGFVDVLMDTAFGGILGAGIGGLGGGLGAWRGHKRQEQFDRIIDRARQELDSLSKDTEFGTPDSGFMDNVGRSEAERVGALSRNEMADLLRAGLSGRDKRDIYRAQEKAIADILAGRPVDVADILRNSPALRNADTLIRMEAQRMGVAYDSAKAAPMAGSPDDIMAVISSPDFEKILVERGPIVQDKNGSFVVSDPSFAKLFGSKGWGVLKFIYKHGEGSKTNKALQVTREDFTALPSVVRDLEPVKTATIPPRKRETRWVVRGADGVDTVYAVSRRKKGHGEQTLITAFKDDTGKYGVSAKRERPASSAGENPHSSGKSPNQDTTGGGFAHSSQRQGVSAQARGETVPPASNEVKQAPDYFEELDSATGERMTLEQEDALAAAKEETMASQIDEMYERGDFTDEDMALLLEAREARQETESFGEMGQAVLECVLEVAE